jgi:hypothetical protein
MHTAWHVVTQDDSVDGAARTLFTAEATASNRKQKSLDDRANQLLMIYTVYRFGILLTAMSQWQRCERRQWNSLSSKSDIVIIGRRELPVACRRVLWREPHLRGVWRSFKTFCSRVHIFDCSLFAFYIRCIKVSQSFVDLYNTDVVLASRPWNWEVEDHQAIAHTERTRSFLVLSLVCPLPFI